MSDDFLEGQDRRRTEYRRDSRVWIHWIGDAVSLGVMLLGLAVTWGGLNERLTAVEKQTAHQEAQAVLDRKEMKSDIQRELTAMTQSLQSMDSKLTQIILIRTDNAVVPRRP